RRVNEERHACPRCRLVRAAMPRRGSATLPSIDWLRPLYHLPFDDPHRQLRVGSRRHGVRCRRLFGSLEDHASALAKSRRPSTPAGGLHHNVLSPPRAYRRSAEATNESVLRRTLKPFYSPPSLRLGACAPEAMDTAKATALYARTNAGFDERVA